MCRDLFLYTRTCTCAWTYFYRHECIYAHAVMYSHTRACMCTMICNAFCHSASCTKLKALAWLHTLTYLRCYPRSQYLLGQQADSHWSEAGEEHGPPSVLALSGEIQQTSHKIHQLLPNSPATLTVLIQDNTLQSIVMEYSCLRWSTACTDFSVHW